MASLVLVELTTVGLPPTVVTQGITLWETGLVHVNLEECGLGVNRHVKVCCCSLQKDLGNHIFRLSELHQCDQEMLLGRFS